MSPLKMNKYFQQVSASTSIPWNTRQTLLLKGADACQYCYDYFSAVIFKISKRPFLISIYGATEFDLTAWKENPQRIIFWFHIPTSYFTAYTILIWKP